MSRLDRAYAARAVPRRRLDAPVRRASSAARCAIRSSSVISRQSVERRAPVRRTCPAPSSLRSNSSTRPYGAPRRSATAPALSPVVASASTCSSAPAATGTAGRRRRAAGACRPRVLRGAGFAAALGFAAGPVLSSAVRTRAGRAGDLAALVLGGREGSFRPLVLATVGEAVGGAWPSSSARARSSAAISVVSWLRRRSSDARSCSM